MTFGEPAGDRRACQVNDGIHAGEQIGVWVARDPLPLIGFRRRVANQPDDRVPTGAQERAQRGTDEPGGAGDRDRQRGQPPGAGLSMCREVIGELAVTVDEHRPQEAAGHRRIDAIGHPGAARIDRFEFVNVLPAHHQCRGQGGHSAAGDLVDEASWPVVGVRLVLSDPPQSAWQREFGTAVTQGGGLGVEFHRLPRWRQPGERARPTVPGEDLFLRSIDDAGVHQSHLPTLPARRVSTPQSASPADPHMRTTARCRFRKALSPRRTR